MSQSIESSVKMDNDAESRKDSKATDDDVKSEANGSRDKPSMDSETATPDNKNSSAVNGKPAEEDADMDMKIRVAQETVLILHEILCDYKPAHEFMTREMLDLVEAYRKISDERFWTPEMLDKLDEHREAVKEIVLTLIAHIESHKPGAGRSADKEGREGFPKYMGQVEGLGRMWGYY